ncbi:MAG: hypothetical protein KDA87_26405, partial [Planctomycetales bacterium]|nr:hypothetical protein [Planctomycetales bacterium]
NAAVHVVFVSDEPSDERIRTNPNGEEPQFAPIRRTLTEMLSALSEQSLVDENGNQNTIHDAVVTAIVPAMFQIPGISDQPNPPKILGVDADVLDRYDLDTDTQLPPSATFDNETHVFVEQNGSISHIESNADITEFYDNNDPAPSNILRFQDADYDQDIIGLLNQSDVAYLPADGFDSSEDFLAQRYFFAERYAFLAWETGGTVWDIEHAIGQLMNGTSGPWEPDDIREQWVENNENVFGTSTRQGQGLANFSKLVVDDIFEKIRLQLVDFDESGNIDLEGDLSAFFDQAVAVLANPNLIFDFNHYDLDGDGQFVDTANGQIDQDDIVRAVAIFATEMGDSNFDYQFGSSDLVTIWTSGQFQDGIDNNSTWSDGDWNGDFDFESDDLVFVFTFGGYEDSQYRDENGDGIPDVLPFWAINMTFTGTVSFYLPSWG